MNLKPIMRILCHQRDDRTYKVCNSYLLVCSRCFGIYAGFLFSFLVLLLIYGFFRASFNVFYAFALLIPMAVDGLTQAFGLRESSNPLRFLTGFLGGLSTAYIFYSLISVIFFQPKFGLLPSFELIPVIPVMLIFLFVLEKFQNSKTIFLKRFFNAIAVFSAVFLILGVLIFYSLVLVRFLRS